jgi:predicted PurR-regulated permease PerM
MNPKSWAEAAFELIWRISVRAALWAGGIYVVYRVRSIIVFVVIAAVLTYALLPIIDVLCRPRIPGLSRKFHRFAATFFVFLITGYLIGVIATEFAKPFGNELNGLQRNSGAYVNQLQVFINSTSKWYHALPDDAQKFIQQQNLHWVADSLTTWCSNIAKGTMQIFDNLLNIVLIPVLAFYFALDPRGLKREFVAIVPKPRVRIALGLIHEINSIMRSYIAGQIVLCIIAGVSIGVILHFMHMPYVLILGAFAGVTRAVPVVGPIVSGLAIVLLGTAQSPITGLKLLIIFSLIQIIESKFIMPKLIGDRMRLHPAVIIIALLIGAEFFGTFGMFMAAPVAALIRVLVRYYMVNPKASHLWGLSHEQIPDAGAGDS